MSISERYSCGQGRSLPTGARKNEPGANFRSTKESEATSYAIGRPQR